MRTASNTAWSNLGARVLPKNFLQIKPSLNDDIIAAMRPVICTTARVRKVAAKELSLRVGETHYP
jgi:hypothetical protein